VQIVLAAGAIGLVGAHLLARAGPQRTGAQIGVIVSSLIGLAALYLKQWAIKKSLNASLTILGFFFLIRLIILTVGVGLASAFHISGLAFAAGFLGIYLVVQWVEIGYLTKEQNRLKREGT
jgi:hypothetical protein